MGAWSNPSTFAQTKVHQGYRQVMLVTSGEVLALRHPLTKPFGPANPFQFVIDELKPVWDAWLSWIEPGGFIIPHRDGGPYRERWQVPICTAGSFDQNGAEFSAQEGIPFRVKQWEKHSVNNNTEHARIHIVLDRDVLVEQPSQAFALLG